MSREHLGISDHRQLDCLYNSFRRDHLSSELQTFCEGKPPVTGGFPSQRASNAENVSAPWRHVFAQLAESLWHIKIPCETKSHLILLALRLIPITPSAGWHNRKFPKFNNGVAQYFTHSLQWRHNEHDSVLNHQSHDCLLNRLFRRRSKKTSKLRVTGLCVGNSPETGESPAQMASNAENVSIWWRHHGGRVTRIRQ